MSNKLSVTNSSKVRYCQNCLKSSLKALSDRAVFTSPHEFFLHLREYHCTKEGGSFACLYGPNGVCPSLPLDGVSELDYQEHVWKDHLLMDRSDRSFMLSQTLCPNQNTSSNPSVVQDQHKWTIYMSQINLPALLNDPRLNKRETDFFTKTWGESFEKSIIQPSQYIPSVTHDQFQQFLLKTSSRRRQSIKFEETIQTSKHNESSLGVASKMEDFDAIPKIFFSSNFSLLEKETFYQVLPWSSVEKFQGNAKSHHSPKLLQEKLSHYLDLVEVQITKQISAKSDAFFEAMLYQNTLQEHLQKTCKSVQFLRDKIRKLDNMLTLQPLQVVKKSSLTSKYKQIYEKLKFMVTVQQTQPTIQLLLSTNDFLGALDLISTTQEVLSQELAGIQCFRHLGSQLHEMEKLIVRMVEDEFTSFTLSFLHQPVDPSDDLTLGTLPSAATPVEDGCLAVDEERLILIIMGLYRVGGLNFLTSFESGSCNTLKMVIRKVAMEMVVASEFVEADTLLTNQLRNLNFSQWLKLLKRIFIALVIVLQRIQKIANIFKFVAKRLVDRREKTVSSEFQGSSSLNKSSSFDALVDVANTSDNVPTLASNDSYVQFTSFTNDHRSDFTDTGAGGETDSKPSNVILATHNARRDANAVEGESNLPKDFSPGDEDWKERASDILKDCDPILSEGRALKIIGVLNEHLSRICEHAHDRCYKLFNIRMKDGFLDNLSMTEFLELSEHIEWFGSQTERICGRRSSLLRGTLLNQTSKLITKFHDERKSKLCLILDHERWKQADVPCEFQDLVDHIQQTGQLSLPAKRLDSGRSQEYLFANGEKYVVVGTALILLKLVVEYCEFVDKLPCAAPEILNRLVELLKTFNSRTCQLILGAGALHLVGLKTISTRNLGLASRCLQLMMSYFPLVKSHFYTRLHSKQLNMIKHFEHLYKDYRDHIAEISVKLVSIMDTVLQGILNKYEVKFTPPSQTFELLLKQTTRFYEAISDLLPEEQVESILRQFHLNFARNFKRQLNVLNFSKDSPGQLNSIEADLKFYVGGVQALPGFKDFSMDLEDILA